MCFYVTRNQIIIDEIYEIISNTHATLLWATGLCVVFVCLKPSTLVNSVLQYVTIVLFCSEQYA